MPQSLSEEKHSQYLLGLLVFFLTAKQKSTIQLRYNQFLTSFLQAILRFFFFRITFLTVLFYYFQVNTQTTVKVKSVNKAEDEPTSLQWAWRPESTDDTQLLGKGEVVVNRLMEQKEVANDASDYLWYMTR